MPEEEVVREIVNKVMQQRKQSCPWAEDIMKSKHEIQDIPVIKKMLWGIYVVLFGTFLVAVINIVLFVNSGGGS